MSLASDIHGKRVAEVTTYGRGRGVIGLRLRFDDGTYLHVLNGVDGLTIAVELSALLKEPKPKSTKRTK